MSDLVGLQFVGFITVGELRKARCKTVPEAPGIYAVLSRDDFEIRFRSESVGGWFKGRNPTVPLATLRERRAEVGEVLYLGMAGTSLRTRVRALVDYGGGRPVGHQGGRLLWQIQDSDALLVGWKEVAAGRATEATLIAQYETTFGLLPFANLQR